MGWTANDQVEWEALEAGRDPLLDPDYDPLDDPYYDPEDYR